MHKTLILLIIFFSILFSCNNKNNSIDDSTLDDRNIIEYEHIEYRNEDINYLKNPDRNDTMCINAVEKAKSDFETYEGVFTHSKCYECPNQPFLNEIKKIISKRKFKLHINEEICVTYQNQTEGCYTSYVKYLMEQKFGKNYYQEIVDQAEHNFFKNNSVADFYDLNYKDSPKFINQNISLLNDGIMPIIHTNLNLDFEPNKVMYITLKFIIEKDGTISNIELDDWINQYPNNEKYKLKLFDIAKEELIEKYNKWTPGKISGQNVRTMNYLRAYFK